MGNVLLPFTHVSDRGSQQSMSISVRTAVGTTMLKERRTALITNTNAGLNPTAAFNAQGVFEPYEAYTLINILLGAQYPLLTGIRDNYYATHQMKCISFIDYKSEHFIVTTDFISQYVELTNQNPSDLTFGVVIDTGTTLHPFFLRAPALPYDDVYMKIPAAHSTVPITEMRYIETIRAHYPVPVIPATMRLDLQMNESRLEYSFGASIVPTCNKRELL